MLTPLGQGNGFANKYNFQKPGLKMVLQPCRNLSHLYFWLIRSFTDPAYTCSIFVVRSLAYCLLKMGLENGMFWSEMGSGFGETGGTPLSRIPRSPPPPPPRGLEANSSLRAGHLPKITGEGCLGAEY